MTYRNVRVTFTNARNLEGTQRLTFDGVAALVNTGEISKGRMFDFVAIDSMTCVRLLPGQITIGAIHHAG